LYFCCRFCEPHGFELAFVQFAILIQLGRGLPPNFKKKEHSSVKKPMSIARDLDHAMLSGRLVTKGNYVCLDLLDIGLEFRWHDLFQGYSYGSNLVIVRFPLERREHSQVDLVPIVIQSTLRLALFRRLWALPVKIILYPGPWRLLFVVVPHWSAQKDSKPPIEEWRN
jgi:hypothetical protein